jgi:polyisoprenoid-binding protein YceI
MNMNNFFKRIGLTVILLAGVGLAQAEEPEVCSPFRDGMVDESLLATMLSAANDGHLYRIQQESSQVGFCVDSKLSQVKGHFHDFQGGITLNSEDNGNGQTMVLIKAASLDTEGSIIENTLKSEGFFDVINHPEILFVSNGFQWTGPDTAVIKGDLTMRGIKKPIFFNVTLTSIDTDKVDQAQKILVKATTTINRADFGMEGLASVASNSVQLCMSVEALKYHS